MICEQRFLLGTPYSYFKVLETEQFLCLFNFDQRKNRKNHRLYKTLDINPLLYIEIFFVSRMLTSIKAKQTRLETPGKRANIDQRKFLT